LINTANTDVTTLYIRTRFGISGGRWRDVELLAVELDEWLGSWDGKNPRIITREILDQVKASLGQMKD
jgi:hypothetical protein